jgi:hypothetical protein
MWFEEVFFLDVLEVFQGENDLKINFLPKKPLHLYF